MARGQEGMLEEMRKSNLRGRGGAGFTTAIKWEACRHAPGERRYVVCNADEGEPGTFKDRVLLQTYAGRVFEGMVIAGYTVRGAARPALPACRVPLSCATAGSFSGGNAAASFLVRRSPGVAGFNFDIEIHLGAGAYVARNRH